MQSNSPSRKRRRMASEVSDIPSHMAKYDGIDDGTPHITRCPPSLAMHWANMSSETSARNRRGSVIRRCVIFLFHVCTKCLHYAWFSLLNCCLLSSHSQCQRFDDVPKHRWLKSLCGVPHMTVECALKAKHRVCTIFNHIYTMPSNGTRLI